MEPKNEKNPFLAPSEIIQLKGFTVIKHFPQIEEEGQINVSGKLMVARLIIIGETHGSRLKPISELISHIALSDEGSLALLVEGEATEQKYLGENILLKKKDKIEILSWDTSVVKEVLSKLFSKVIGPGNLALSSNLEIYLKKFSFKDLRGISGLIVALQERLEELNNEVNLREYFDDDFENKLKILNGLGQAITDCLNKLEDSNEELLLLNHISDYYIELSSLVELMSVQSLKSRNSAMVDNIHSKLSTHEKVIVVAGRLHLSAIESPEMKDNLHVQAGIKSLESLDLPFDELEYIMLEAPLPEDTNPEPIPLPPDFLDTDDKELEEKFRGLNEKTKNSLEPLEAKKLNFNRGIKDILEADLKSLRKIFAKMRADICRDMEERGTITTTDNIALAALMINTLKRLIFLKKEASSSEKKCSPS
ncbi:hypothetical protein PHSC3_001195 [Chlamydiales bacterium STE3]|nr:hypothetical protein PHSC3_001195 [Chlamydiales bacterium STE3]